MKTFIDSKLLKKIISPIHENSFIESCKDANILSQDQSFKVIFTWASLLEYIELGEIFETFPKFDEKNVLFSCFLSPIDLSNDVIIELYDQIFVECLTVIKALPEINASFLSQKIKQKSATSLFASSLSYYDRWLIENPYDALHDLILYLAFDRVCVYLTILFEHPSSQIHRLEIIQECLIESFQHITKDGKTTPGFFRLVEALYAYQMREENLQRYSDSEWLILCQSVNALKSREALIDLFYIDAAIVNVQEIEKKKPLKGFTIDSLDIVKVRLILAKYMMEKLQREIPGWKYTLFPCEIFHVKEYEGKFHIEL